MVTMSNRFYWQATNNSNEGQAMTLVLAVFLFGFLFVSAARADQSSTDTNAQDTIILQQQALKKINRALSRGSLTPEEASDFKEQLNDIGAKETWYKSLAFPVPAELIKADIEKIESLNTAVSKNSKLSLNTSQASDDTHSDIHKLISRALANNKISNSQAENIILN